MQIKFLTFDLMLKKYAAILFLSLACAILLAHNIISHHHHVTNHDLVEHHQKDHHHDDNQKDDELNHLLSYFTHPDDGFTFITNHNICNTFSNQLFSIVAILPDYFFLDKFLIPPLLHKPPAEHFIYISPHSLSLGLRAPPAFIV